jgi:hypothetical protein
MNVQKENDKQARHARPVILYLWVALVMFVAIASCVLTVMP